MVLLVKRATQCLCNLGKGGILHIADHSFITCCCCSRQALCREHLQSAHGEEAGALAAALIRAGQKPGSSGGYDESAPVTGADASATLAKMRSADPSLPAVKPDDAVKLLRYEVCRMHWKNCSAVVEYSGGTGSYARSIQKADDLIRCNILSDIKVDSFLEIWQGGCYKKALSAYSQ